MIGSLFSYSFHYIYSTNTINNDSLVNTLQNLDTINPLPESAFPILNPNNLHRIDVGVQTSEINVDVGVQASNIHVDVCVQTNSLWSIFKDWLFDKLSIFNVSIPSTPSSVRIDTWMENLDTNQTVSSPSMISDISTSDPKIMDNVFLLDYANSQETWDIGSRVEYINTVSQELNVELETLFVHGVQHMFIIIQDVILTVNPEIFYMF